MHFTYSYKHHFVSAHEIFKTDGFICMPVYLFDVSMIYVLYLFVSKYFTLISHATNCEALSVHEGRIKTFK